MGLGIRTRQGLGVGSEVRAVAPLSPLFGPPLLVASRTRNADRGVTGLLLYRGGRVLQMLEGEESVVRALYDRIQMDRSITTGEPLSSGVCASSARVEESLSGSDAGPPRLVVSPGQADYLQRRAAVLRRVLASGDRLAGALGIILNGHDPQEVATADGRAQLCCRICQTHDAPELDAYPSATVKTALWALEAAGPR